VQASALVFREQRLRGLPVEEARRAMLAPGGERAVGAFAGSFA